MNFNQERRRSLLEIERQIMEEGREWMRKRLQEELQKEADRDGEIFPPQQPKTAASAATADAIAHGRRGG